MPEKNDSSFYDSYSYIRFLRENELIDITDEEFFDLAGKIIFPVNKYILPKNDSLLTELDKIVKERLQKNHSIGFGAELYSEEELNEGRLLGKASVDDLRAFGMIPEFLGRLPVIVALEPLSEEFLARILTEPKNAIIKQYQKLFAMDEVKLEFEHEALLTIARRALDKKTGARALRAVLEEFMQDIMYEIPKDPSIGQVIITADYLEHRGGPIIKIRGTEE